MNQPSPKKKVPKKITPNYLKNSGLFYLQRYIASSHQFQRAMRRKIDRSCYVHTELDKAECYQWLDDVTEEFQRLGYLNDSAYLKGMLTSLRFSKGLSLRMILSKMRDKGFSEIQVRDALTILEEEHADLESDPDFERQAADRFAKRKKLGKYHPTPPRKNYDQQLSSLARAGFSYDICKKIMDDHDKP